MKTAYYLYQFSQYNDYKLIYIPILKKLICDAVVIAPYDYDLIYSFYLEKKYLALK